MHYDLVVIGGGPAGNEVASYAIHKGWKVAIFEERAFGGTCLNVGCIPSKGYLHRAKLISELKRHRISYDEGNKYFSLAELQSFSERTINRMAIGIEQRVVAKGIDVFKEKVVSFEKNELVTSSGKVVKFEKLVIACGSKPAFPGVLKQLKDKQNVYTNENIFQLKDFPESMTVIGGGAIGVEMAFFFSSFGVKVDLIEAMPSILAYYDDDIITEAKKILKKKRVNILENVQVVGVDGLTIELSNGHKLTNSCVLVATGRTLSLPETKLNLDKDARGFLQVNDNYQTSEENIYAIGDANGKSLFAHSATDQGKQLGRLLLKGITVDQFRVIPAIVYTSPAIATVGVREKDATTDYVVKKLPYEWLGRAHIERETEGFIKLIFKEDIVVGAHIIGAYAEEIVSVMCLAITQKLSLNSLRRLILAHPTYGELLIEGF